MKWARDLHQHRNRAARARTETWSRVNIQRFSDISRASSQSLMKAIGGVEVVGGMHFIERPALLAFLDEIIAASSVEVGLHARLHEAPPAVRMRVPDSRESGTSAP